MNEQEEIRIGSTLFKVKREFSGEDNLERIMTEWAVRRTLADMQENTVPEKKELPKKEVSGLVVLQ